MPGGYGSGPKPAKEMNEIYNALNAYGKKSTEKIPVSDNDIRTLAVAFIFGTIEFKPKEREAAAAVLGVKAETLKNNWTTCKRNLGLMAKTVGLAAETVKKVPKAKKRKSDEVEGMQENAEKKVKCEDEDKAKDEDEDEAFV